ncbi:PD-(D/E)XK nuclease-like domain-containing protein [Spirosoma sordidisoli]|uniref:Putative exodeoxyribonuclease 8 PDDEXK-like domain-containing protein n=1 Tax=Spirosoma sordidisoli TaxID=2502893 RepID=A0A4Q2UMS3_9BACT|nr:PD-(D/E)XK nuclease-like domain-containing protein [Spirosoma sordidisoli]RYC70082.1 hypothetical protein EQG79_09430 [Spirosoma sordidisoli]
MDYRSLHRIANSDLSEFRAHIFGEKQYKPAAAFAFGSALHTLILEPQAVVSVPADVDLSLCMMLARIARNYPFVAWALRFSQKERVQLWQDTATGLELKSRLDIVHKNSLVVDLKSTSCKSYADFLRSCETYDYDRQAAFYLDAIGGKKFVFVAIQKVAPYTIWTVEHHTDGPFIQAGRRKYKALLREWKRRTDAGTPFVPTSWNHQLQTDPALC